MKFNNTFLKLGDDFYSNSNPFHFDNPNLIILNDELAKQLDFDFKSYNDKELAEIFTGNKKLEGSEFISQVYAAHQFGHFVPILGDGRAMLIGEVLDKNNYRLDVQLKGAGPTKYSRRGDGFSALGPVLREYIVSEFMTHIKIPSTRALAVVATNNKVYREKVLPGGVLTRIAKSHIRIGTFQYFFSRNDFSNLKLLLKYSIERHFPHLLNLNSKEWPLAFLNEVIKAQSSLIAKWMGVGFIHGVMNTDNMTISGETIDFGPCAFLDSFDFNKVYSSIDQNGRYRFSNQPNIMQWNLARLADTLITTYKEENNISENEAIQIFNESLSKIGELFQREMLVVFSKKLSIENETNELKEEIIFDLLKVLHENELDFTLSFRSIADFFIDSNIEFKKPLEAIIDKLKSVHLKNGISLVEVGGKMNEVNPIYIPRNHLIEEIIESAYLGNFEPFKNYVEILKSPYKVNNSIAIKYKQSPRKEQIVQNTFCGT